MPNRKRLVPSEESTVVVLPESDERTLCVSLRGNVTYEDYDRYFYQRLQEFADKKIRFGLLIEYGDYQGWNENAAARSFESIIDHGKMARKMAYVGAPDSKMMQVKISEPLLGGEARFFEPEELEAAIAWVKAD